MASLEAILQMAIKAVNDTAGHDGLILTLFVFDAYLWINLDLPPSLSTLKCANAIQKKIHGLRKPTAKNQISTALGIRNGLITENTLALLLQSKVQVWREKEG